MKEINEEVRKYGNHFSEETVKKEMPKIEWNAQIRSSRAIIDLDALYIMNYKEAFAVENRERDDIVIKLKFVWKEDPLNLEEG